MGVMGAALASLVTQIFTNVIMGFLIKNVRRNNYLMWKGCNPKVLIEMLKFRRKEDENNGANA
jgi:Na+-driven multidrug efflux pump